MAGFKSHITTSTFLGVGYGVAGHFVLDAPLSTSLLAGGLCSVSGMLPDLDSDSGVPVRETMSFAAAVVPMLMMNRFEQLGWSQEMMVVVGGLLYVSIRFGAAALFKKYTVHRGMWHSIPAAAIVGLLAFMVCSSEDLTLRIFKAGGVVMGFMSHLVLDEIWSVQVQRGRLRFKKSFGTALKFWGRSGWANFSVYGKLAILVLMAVGDPVLMQRYGLDQPGAPRLARQSDPLAADPAADSHPVSHTPRSPFPVPSPIDQLVPAPVDNTLQR